MMARSMNAPFTGRIQKRKTIISIHHIWLATHGRSIQLGQPRPLSDLAMSASPPTPDVWLRRS
jgi:hypothetical protein